VSAFQQGCTWLWHEGWEGLRYAIRYNAKQPAVPGTVHYRIQYLVVQGFVVPGRTAYREVGRWNLKVFGEEQCNLTTFCSHAEGSSSSRGSSFTLIFVLEDPRGKDPSSLALLVLSKLVYHQQRISETSTIPWRAAGYHKSAVQCGRNSLQNQALGLVGSVVCSTVQPEKCQR
jgi:hypothetical protein